MPARRAQQRCTCSGSSSSSSSSSKYSIVQGLVCPEKGTRKMRVIGGEWLWDIAKSNDCCPLTWVTARNRRALYEIPTIMTRSSHDDELRPLSQMWAAPLWLRLWQITSMFVASSRSVKRIVVCALQISKTPRKCPKHEANAESRKQNAHVQELGNDATPRCRVPKRE